jgi:hypothetical protein
MAIPHKTVAVTDDTALTSLLDDASREPVILVRGGERFRLSREDDLFAGYDPERARRALRESVGALAGVDVAALKEELREQRSQDSHGRPA